MEKKIFTEQDRGDAIGPNPENIPTDKESLYDMHEDMKTVDALPLDDLAIETGRENIRRNTERQSPTAEDLSKA